MSSEDNVNASLELLLDTICNTFGGVLFISMLVVIMTNLTSKQVTFTPPTETAQAEMAQAERDLEIERKRLDTLRSQLRQQTDFEQNVVDRDARRLLREVTSLKDRRSALSDDRSQALESASQSQTEVNEIARELDRLEKATSAAKAAASAIERKLRAEIAARSQAAKLPKLRPTTKEEVAFFLKQGRLIPYARMSPERRLIPNQTGFVETTEGNQRVIEPKSGAGIAVNVQGDTSGEVSRTFADFDKQKHYLAIFVWPDSFDHFAIVKDAMVLSQFEYRLVVVPKDQKVSVTTTPGSSMVQ